MIGSLGSTGGAALSSIDELLKLLALVGDPEQARVAAEELRGLIKGLADERGLLGAKIAESEKARQAADEDMQAVGVERQGNAKRASELDARAAALEGEFAKLATAQTQFKQVNDAFETRSSATATDLTAREDSVARREALLKQAEQDVAAMRDDLQVRLDRIRAATA